MSYTPRAGLNVPAITVTDDQGRMIAEEQRRVFRHLVQQGFGADVIFGNGTTGEWNRLKNAERQRVIEIEIDEIKLINARLRELERPPVECWVGVNGSTKAEVLANLDLAIQLRADAAVIAPLAIADLNESETVSFFQREITDLLDSSATSLPVLLYDNADIAAAGREPHIRTRTVKQLSRLEWIAGIKVSAPRHVLGNYTKAALHFKQPGEFGIYIGDAMLIFEWYRPREGFLGRLREGWRDYLLHDTLPIGVVSGPGNVLPREWKKSWRACWSGDEESMSLFRSICEQFERVSEFEENGAVVKKAIACLKEALRLDGIISSSAVVEGTRALNAVEREKFAERYEALKARIRRDAPSIWQTVRSGVVS
jgi:dihydrodipicolinate synthase/N-acetylneuraminate lyase